MLDDFLPKNDRETSPDKQKEDLYGKLQNKSQKIYNEIMKEFSGERDKENLVIN